MKFPITRKIEIDAAHRVPTHGSKCANIHGHRYVVEATCVGDTLQKAGEQSSMTMDFGFLKQVMVRHVDEPCDHGMILWVDDPWLDMWFLGVPTDRMASMVSLARATGGVLLNASWANAPRSKIYLVNFIPTSEELARHWFNRMFDDVKIESRHNAVLRRVRVYETPNCWSDYGLD